MDSDFITAKFLWGLAMYAYAKGADNELIVGLLDESHDLDPNADPDFHPEDYSQVD